MSQEEFILRLKDKLLEEAEEVRNAGNLTDLVEELADVQEILYTLAKTFDISIDQIETKRLQKRAISGGFEQKIYSHFIDIDEYHPEIHYYQTQPNRYPELSITSDHTNMDSV